jgi:hypothetical protein
MYTKEIKQEISLNEYLEDIRSGKILIPALQRPLYIKKGEIIGITKTIFNKGKLGQFHFWVPDNAKDFEDQADHDNNTIITNINDNKPNKIKPQGNELLIIDGQQRSSSFNIAFNGNIYDEYLIINLVDVHNQTISLDSFKFKKKNIKLDNNFDNKECWFYLINLLSIKDTVEFTNSEYEKENNENKNKIINSINYLINTIKETEISVVEKRCSKEETIEDWQILNEKSKRTTAADNFGARLEKNETKNKLKEAVIKAKELLPKIRALKVDTFYTNRSFMFNLEPDSRAKNFSDLTSLDNQMQKSIDYFFNAIDFCENNGFKLNKKNSYNLLSTILYKYSPEVIDKDKNKIISFIKKADQILSGSSPRKHMVPYLITIKTTCEKDEFPIEQLERSISE